MEIVAEKLRAAPDSVITITTEPDIICFACPYYKNNQCAKKKDSEKKTRKHDLEIIKKFGFKKGEKKKIGWLWQKIKKEIIPRDMVKICPNCEWVEYCSKFSSFNI